MTQKQTNDLGLGMSDVHIKHVFHVLAAKLQDTRNPVAGGVVAIKDPNDQDILVAKLRIKLRLRYSIEELAEDYITRARVRQQDRRGKKMYRALRFCHSCLLPADVACGMRMNRNPYMGGSEAAHRKCQLPNTCPAAAPY